MKTQCRAHVEDSTDASLNHEPPPVYQILVVDDDPDVRQLLTDMLTRFGYIVATAGDGEAAWRALATVSFNLLITDHSMPKVTGVELIRKLREAGRNVPVIMATGTIPREELERDPSLKPAAIITKPFTKAELLRTVVEVLGTTYGVRGRTNPPVVG